MEPHGAPLIPLLPLETTLQFVQGHGETIFNDITKRIISCSHIQVFKAEAGKREVTPCSWDEQRIGVCLLQWSRAGY